jgi:enolase
MKIKEVRARRIFNSKGGDAIEVEVKSDIRTSTASIGAGTSVSGNAITPYPENIKKLVNLVNKTFNKDLKGIQINNFGDLEKIERYTKSHDFTENLEKIGGNVIVALELAILKSASEGPLHKFLEPKNKKLPMPLGNVVGGGHHSYGKGPDIQEFLVLPRIKNFNEAAEINVEIHDLVKEELVKRDKQFTGTKNMEGGWSTSLSNMEIIPLLNKIIDKVSKERKVEVRLGMDVAANELWNGRRYEYKRYSKVQPKKNFKTEEQISFMKKLIINNNLIYVEDPFHDKDFDSFEELNKEACLICGDDLIATNPERLGESKRKISAVIIKPNQIGSLLKAKEAVDIAKKLKIMPVISHRSGETNDNSIAHLAVGWGCPIIKTGIVGGERVSKINELLRINEEI